MIGVTCDNHVPTGAQPSRLTDDGAHLTDHSAPSAAPPGCGNPRQVVSKAWQYFNQHFPDPIQMPALAESLGTSLPCLVFSFEQIRQMTPLQALQDLRLNHLFAVLSDQPQQGLGRAILACGLGDTPSVPALFEQEFGIAMAHFLQMSRRAADDRRFRLEHPEAEALVLPL